VTDESKLWKTLSSRTVYENPWMRVTEDHVVTPKGAKGVYEVTRFPAPGCSILALDAEGHTWIVGQHRYAIGRYSWEIPAGSIGDDPDPLAGARRELAEETGLRAGRWHRFLHLAPINAATNLESFGFVAWDLTPGEQNPDEGEELALRRLPFAQVLEMVLSGEITSAVSMASVLQAHLLALHGRMPPEVTPALRAGR
jgi:8-oxo-dGTP pyrophosphatase MutT (NUDIX family)